MSSFDAETSGRTKANWSTVMNERMRSIRRTRFDTAPPAGWSTASQHSARSVTLTKTKTAAYVAIGAAASRLPAIHSVVNRISDTENRCAKFDHTSRGVDYSAWVNR